MCRVVVLIENPNWLSHWGTKLGFSILQQTDSCYRPYSSH